ncbi:MAG: efflux RND transporter periplasmic adaptor subunit [Chitinophagia bacterium]|nr:efflux RND transporter periplasmic adaptor subunit [Chitinophagia bacterium]
MNRISLSAIIFIASFISSCKHAEEEKEEQPRFQVTSPVRMDTVVYRKYVGQVRSSSHIELRSQERGYLEKIYFDEGQFVRKGQLLFKIMPLVYEAEAERARAEVNFAEIEYGNTKSLADSNVVSPNELALARAKLKKAKAELSLAEAHLGFTEIRAPFDGIMDRFERRLGSLIDEGELLTSLSDNRHMWVYFNVPEVEYLDYMRNARKGSRQTVQLQLANKEIFEQPGVVETIEADFNNETGNIAFRAGFSNPRGILRHGETGSILMPVALKDAILIPQKSTYDVIDRKYVYVVDDKGIVRSREITVSLEMPHLYVVSSGIAPVDRIISEGLGKVKDGEKVEFEMVSFEKIMDKLKGLHAE